MGEFLKIVISLFDEMHASYSFCLCLAKKDAMLTGASQKFYR